jgi:hypothetical protein
MEITMMSDPPIWSSWTNSLPQRPLSTDAFVDGAFRRPRGEALQHPNIEFNPPVRVAWFMYDIDTPESFECWFCRRPTSTRKTDRTVEGISAIALGMPVGLAGLSRDKPFSWSPTCSAA